MSDSETERVAEEQPPEPEEQEGTEGVQQRTSFRPKKPKFGGLVQTGTETWVAWTGGKPNKNWTGLEKVKPKSIQPNQYRSSSLANQSKSQAYRRNGLEPKFTRKSNLPLFQVNILNHAFTITLQITSKCLYYTGQA